jgi:hypothetical protein
MPPLREFTRFFSFAERKYVWGRKKVRPGAGTISFPV